MQREPTAISLVAMAMPNIPVRSHRPMSENVVNSMPAMKGPPLRDCIIRPLQMKFVGVPIKRLEDPRLLVGGGRFVDDVVRPHMVHAVLVRSPHAHARVRRVDVRRALALPGVLARSEEHTSELQSLRHLVCRLLLEK